MGVALSVGGPMWGSPPSGPNKSQCSDGDAVRRHHPLDPSEVSVVHKDAMALIAKDQGFLGCLPNLAPPSGHLHQWVPNGCRSSSRWVLNIGGG